MKINVRIVLIGFVALVAGTYLQLFGFNAPIRKVDVENPGIEGFYWPQQKRLSEFHLTSSKNTGYGLENLKGKWSFVFFGYTHCPDICPITMNTLRLAREQMRSASDISLEDVNFLFVSVDGERDTPEHLDKYIGYFGESFQALTGSREQVDSLTGQLGVPYTIDDHEPGDTGYLVGHSASIFLISPTGQLASIYHAPHSTEQITDRFSEILRFYANQS